MDREEREREKKNEKEQRNEGRQNKRRKEARAFALSMKELASSRALELLPSDRMWPNPN